MDPTEVKTVAEACAYHVQKAVDYAFDEALAAWIEGSQAEGARVERHPDDDYVLLIDGVAYDVAATVDVTVHDLAIDGPIGDPDALR